MHNADLVLIECSENRLKDRKNSCAGNQQHTLNRALGQKCSTLWRTTVAENNSSRLKQRDRIHEFTSIAPTITFCAESIRRFSSQPQNVHSVFTSLSAGKSQLAP